MNAPITPGDGSSNEILTACENVAYEILGHDFYNEIPIPVDI